MFTIRDRKPTKGNKFYTTTAKGGASWCIQGSPKDKECDVLANCVGYACGRFNEIIGTMDYKKLNCNAENFITRAKSLGLSVSNTPTLGGIMVWANGKVGNSKDGVGHVAIVERIDNQNQIYTSESNWGGKSFFNATRKNTNKRWGLGSGYKFLGCIINPKLGAITQLPKEPLLPLKDIALEVLDGKHGNGNARKVKLEKLGYDYYKVQAEVNAILAVRKAEQKAKEKAEQEELMAKALEQERIEKEKREEQARLDELARIEEERVQAETKPVETQTIKVGDWVKPIKKIDYVGRSLVQWDSKYKVTSIVNGNAVLKAPRGKNFVVWAKLKVTNLKKV